MKGKAQLWVMIGIWLLSGCPLLAADQATVETRLREALRNTMLQLRAAETEKATLQADKAQADETNKDLKAKVELLTKKTDATDKKVAEQEAEIAKLQEANGKWQTVYQQTTELARQKESERAKLAAQVIVLQRQVDDQERKNLALFKLGNEILSRYEHFGLGDALSAKEPFVGITRVRLENLVQDYRDKLTDQRIKP